MAAIADRPPDWMRLAGLVAYDRREPHVPVARLDLDTLMPQSADADVPRLLRFTTSRHTVVLTATSRPRAVTLAISVSPPGVVGIDVRPLHGSVRRVWTDARGVASCRSVPPGPVSLLVRWTAAQGGPIRTAWTQV